MTPWVVWAVVAVVAVLHAFTAYHFSVRTLRAVSLIVALALVVGITACGQAAPGRVPSDLGSAFAFGSDRLSDAFFRPVWALRSGRPAPAPGRLGWAAIGVVLLIAYRQCETWALRRQAPTLDTSTLREGQPGGDATAAPAGSLNDSQWHDWLAAELRFRLAAVEVRSPPILPGGSRSAGLASIVEATGVTGAGLAGAIVSFFSTFWPAPRRYELRVWRERPAPASTTRAPRPRAAEADVRDSAADDTRVTVELDDPGTGETVATKTVVAAGVDDAASMAAGFVARQIFARDPATPPWCFGAVDGRDLGALLLARLERVHVESARDVGDARRKQIDALWPVTLSNRCAGIVRYEHAQLEDLEREHLNALRLHALNRAQYPRFFRGVYRLCMSLDMVADPEFTFSHPDIARNILNEVLAVLWRSGVAAADRCADDDIRHDDTGGHYALSPALRATLLKAARIELRMIRRQLYLPFVVWNTFARRNERAVWKPHWHRATRQAFRDGVCVAELLIAAKLRLNDLTVTRGHETSWQAPTFAEKFGHRLGLRIAAAIAGDTRLIRTVLYHPVPGWRGPDAPLSRAGGTVPVTRNRVRWLPGQTRSASWPAAYNTACLYAVLVRHGLAREEDVIASLGRVVGDPGSELDRPSAWIYNDMDFAPLLRDGSPYKKTRDFLAAQNHRDYPHERQTFSSR